MTGLLNHEAYKNDVEMELLEGKKKIVFLMMDVDHFKKFNDTRGHRAGDELLILLAGHLTGMMRSGDLAARMGGDEFSAAIMFEPDVSDHSIRIRIRQIFEKLNAILKMDDFHMSISMGAVIRDESFASFNQLYEAADQALYSSKERARGRLTIYQKTE